MKKNIVFIHGSAGSRRNFKYLIKNLSEYNIIAFDLIGFGNEKKPKISYDLELYLNFIKDKLDWDQSYVMVGHSMGGILAKELALKYPNNVKKIFCINYPFNKQKIKNNLFNRLFIDGHWLGKAICHSKMFWKFLALPLGLLLYGRYFGSLWDYFKHTFQSESSTLRNVILNYNHSSLNRVKNKLILISGEKDPFLIKSLAESYKNYEIKKMGHLFFGFEKEIADIIRKEA